MKQSRMEDVLPLSPLQEGLLFHALYDERGRRRLHRCSSVLDLDGRLDTGGAGGRRPALLQRHADLRAGFRHAGRRTTGAA